MKTRKIMIVEDGRDAQENMAALIELFCPNVEIVGYADSIRDAVSHIHQHHPDIIFMNIMLRDENALDLLEVLIPINLHVVFTTSLDGYAVDAFKANAVDYLMKPIDPTRLINAVNNDHPLFDSQNNEYQFKNLLQTLKKDKINRLCILSQDQEIAFIDINEIKYIKGNGTHSVFHMTDGRKIDANKNLNYYYSILEKSKFFRCHHSYIVNIDLIIHVDPANGIIALEDDVHISVTRNRRDELIDILG